MSRLKGGSCDETAAIATLVYVETQYIPCSPTCTPFGRMTFARLFLCGGHSRVLQRSSEDRKRCVRLRLDCRRKRCEMKRSGIKATIEYVVRLLNVIGVTCLTPETIRQAKFNGPEVTGQLWRALHDLILLVLANFPEENPGRRLQELWARLNDEGQPPGMVYALLARMTYGTQLNHPIYALLSEHESRANICAGSWFCRVHSEHRVRPVLHGDLEVSAPFTIQAEVGP
eukprot:1189273-Prorocentrum_minimum.AAC.2